VYCSVRGDAADGGTFQDSIMAGSGDRSSVSYRADSRE
jgi:hypothetical protein